MICLNSSIDKIFVHGDYNILVIDKDHDFFDRIQLISTVRISNGFNFFDYVDPKYVNQFVKIFKKKDYCLISENSKISQYLYLISDQKIWENI
jgi:hypothetical protein